MKYVVVCCALHDGECSVSNGDIEHNIFDTEEEAKMFIEKDIYLVTGGSEFPDIYVYPDGLSAEASVVSYHSKDKWLWETIPVKMWS